MTDKKDFWSGIIAEEDYKKLEPLLTKAGKLRLYKLLTIMSLLHCIGILRVGKDGLWKNMVLKRNNKLLGTLHKCEVLFYPINLTGHSTETMRVLDAEIKGLFFEEL